ncbi:MAG: hypothetical protein ACRD22_02980 [Terriglobia bacterium]
MPQDTITPITAVAKRMLAKSAMMTVRAMQTITVYIAFLLIPVRLASGSLNHHHALTLKSCAVAHGIQPRSPADTSNSKAVAKARGS